MSEPQAQPLDGSNPASSVSAPYRAQDVQAVSGLVRSLEESTKKQGKGGFKVRKNRFQIAGSRDGLSVDSWRFQDWDYKRRDLPTYARGLFTTRSKGKDHAIAVRGYDKFFNVGEVRATEWDNIRKNTQGPYELTLKENGCIIFVAGLEDDTLLVCSKHSTGARSDIDVSHAAAGEVRLERQLARIGRTKQDLARELRTRNVTAVAELCDDSFEEHILAYGPDNAGLYLHGINLNVPDFATYPSRFVQAFAAEWGFVQTGLMVMHDVDEVKAFLEQVAETGAHDGRDVEGFVIRCKMSPRPGTDPHRDWFFKYKFEEPYLMYRQWRECTKAMISGKTPKYRKHKQITEEYMAFARKRLVGDPKLAKEYGKNHGIIALRNEFLEFKNLKGSDAANFDIVFGKTGANPDVKDDVILAPISTIGCGKTTLAVALTHLFDFGHVQNDNIMGKGRPPRFVKWVLDELKEHKAVFADRNNAQRHERKQLISDVKIQHGTARLVALHFVHDDVDEVRRVTQGRVLARGDNHQTIQAASDKDKAVGIMEGFIQRFEPCDEEAGPDAGFDAIINLDPTAGSRANLETLVNELHDVYPNLIPTVPAAEELDMAIEAALGEYKPELRHTIPDRGGRGGPGGAKSRGPPPPPQGKKKKGLEYMSVSVPTRDVLAALEKAFANATPEQSRMYKMLQQTRRVQPQFHVTLMHKASANENPELWGRYVRLLAEAEEANPTAATYQGTPPGLGECDVQLERVVFDDRIMAIVVRLLVTEEDKWECVNKIPHVTVGTRDHSVKPKESNVLLARWTAESEEGGAIREIAFEGRPIVKGTVRGVLSR